MCVLLSVRMTPLARLTLVDSIVVTNLVGQRVPSYVARQEISVQVVERDPPKLHLVNLRTRLKTLSVSVWLMLCLVVFLLNPDCLPVTAVVLPPFTVWCSRLVLLSEQLVSIRVTRTIRLRQTKMLHAGLRTGLREGRGQWILVLLRPWVTQLPLTFEPSGLGWHSVIRVMTLLKWLGCSPCISLPTLCDLSRNIVAAE